MKAFQCNMFFALPDDFDGNINDAFNEVIKYRLGKAKERKEGGKKLHNVPMESASWDSYIGIPGEKNFNEEGNRFTAVLSISEKVGDEWVELDAFKKELNIERE